MNCHITLVCLSLFVAPLDVLNADNQIRPLPKVDVGMHLSAITSGSVNSDGSLLLTTSSDKEARLWGLPEGRLLRVFRIPLTGGPDQGQLYSGALNTDGTLAAVGGSTADKTKSVSIHIFDTSSGRIIQNLRGLPDVVLNIKFSDGGKLLAAGLGNGGIRIWETSKWTEVTRDENYAGRCSGLDWQGDQSLITTCYDGNVRVYDFTKLTIAGASRSNKSVVIEPSLVKRMNSGKVPYSVSINPDGKQIAIGFENSQSVDVYSMKDLSLAFSAKPRRNYVAGSPASVSWSADGKLLAAAGTLLQTGKARIPICVWETSGKREATDTPVAENSILSLASLPGGGWLYTTADPAFGTLSQEGARERIHVLAKPGTADFRDGVKSFMVSDDAKTVAFSLEPLDGRPCTFRTLERKFSNGISFDDYQSLRRLDTESLNIKSWRAGFGVPTLKGRKLFVSDFERSSSLSIASDSSAFILGTEWFVHAFEKDGKLRWTVDANGPAWQVAYSPDKKLCVAGFGDGTIRWYRASDGVEILVLYPHPDGKRWVLWSSVHEPSSKQVAAYGAYTSDAPHSAGARVEVVAPSGAAAQAGLATGDIITKWNGEIIRSRSDLINKKASAEPGNKIEIAYLHSGKVRKATIVTEAQMPYVTNNRVTYYDCSPGGEDLIGWIDSRDQNHTADFFPAARFRPLLYRPDVIQQVLNTLDLSSAVRQANAALGKSDGGIQDMAEVIERLSPPVVEMECGGVYSTIEIPVETSAVKLRYRVRNTGKEMTVRMDIRFNGRPLDLTAPVPDGGDVAEVEVPIPHGMEGELSIIASNRFSSSEAAFTHVKRSGPTADIRKPVLHLIAAGVSDLKMDDGLDSDGDGKISDTEILGRYPKAKAFLEDLRLAAKDAQRLADTLTIQKGRLFSEVKTTLLIDAEATTGAFRKAIKQAASEAQPGDVVLVFFSGHGAFDPTAGFFVATYDTEPENPGESAMTGKEVTELLRPIKSTVVLVLDTCHSAAALGKFGSDRVVFGPGDLTGLVNTLSSAEEGVIVFSSSAEKELSFERGDSGLFTAAFIDGLNGGAEKVGGRVTCSSLNKFISKRVPDLINADPALSKAGVIQTPSFILPRGVPDFPLAAP